MSVPYGFSISDLIGWDLDEVLEGPDVVPVAVVADRETQVVTLPALTEDERAAMEFHEEQARVARKLAAEEFLRCQQEERDQARQRRIPSGKRWLWRGAWRYENGRIVPDPASAPPPPEVPHVAGVIVSEKYQEHLDRRRADGARRAREAVARHAARRRTA